MKKLDKYINDLTKKVKVNKKALKISEKGVDMAKKSYLGYYLPYMKTDENDVILKIETTGVDIGSQMISLVRVDREGLTLIARDDRSFSQKLLKMLSDLDGKRVFIYHQNFTMRYLERYLQGTNFDLIDLREEGDMMFQYGTMEEGVKSHIDIPWDPCTPDVVPELWMDGNVDVIKKHAIAEAIRLYHLYVLYVAQNVLGINKFSGTPIYHIPKTAITGAQKVKLPNPTGYP